MQTNIQAQGAQQVMLFDEARRAGEYPIFHSVLKSMGTEVLKIRKIIGLQALPQPFSIPRPLKEKSLKRQNDPGKRPECEVCSGASREYGAHIHDRGMHWYGG
jgi:hypothetical protein